MSQKYYKIHVNQSVIILAETAAIADELKIKETHSSEIYGGPHHFMEAFKALEILEKAHPYIIYQTNLTQMKDEIFKLFKVVKASGGIVLNDEGEFLMIYRKGKWDLPKGKLESGEKKKAGAKREVEEETNVKILKVGDRFCVTYHTYYDRGKMSIKQSYWYPMLGDSHSKIIPQMKEGIYDARWVTELELPDYLEDAYTSVQEIFENWFKDRPQFVSEQT